MKTTYDVFARKEHAEPLVYIGSVEADNDEDVAKRCLERYGPESDWVEMVSAPHNEVIVVFAEQKEQAS
jgi:1,2-phenylacetyl-CoA epoxidase PaaB subunit